jgi:hypothetical protein
MIITPLKFNTSRGVATTTKSPCELSATATSIERFQNLAFNYNKICQTNESESLKKAEKFFQEERAKYLKSKAILEQQTELLTL